MKTKLSEKREPDAGHDRGDGHREGPEGEQPPKPLAVSETRPFLSRGDVSRLFGVSVSTVTRWARLGMLRVLRTPGGHYRFPAEETQRAALTAAAAHRAADTATTPHKESR